MLLCISVIIHNTTAQCQVDFRFSFQCVYPREIRIVNSLANMIDNVLYF